MKNILIDMFKEFNQEARGIYFVDLVDEEVKYSKADGENTKICSLDSVKSANYSNGMILLQADISWQLQKEGPEELFQEVI
jgi:hypothetical protein